MITAFLVCVLIGIAFGLIGGLLDWPGWFSTWLAFIVALVFMITVGTDL